MCVCVHVCHKCPLYVMSPIIWDMSRGHITCDMPLFGERGGEMERDSETGGGARSRQRERESESEREREREKERERDEAMPKY